MNRPDLPPAQIAGIRLAEAKVALRIIFTREQLAELRVGATILDTEEDILQRARPDEWDTFLDLDDDIRDAEVGLPAVVLYEPEGETR